nr:RNHCP domain-containing protein [Deinococcota bacterium]
DCGGVLEPVGVDYSAKKGWIILSRCRRCGEVRRNKAALDDPLLPDDYEVLIALSRAPRQR